MNDLRIARILEKTIDVPDFPKPGIVFKDLTPVFADRDAFRLVIDLFAEQIDPASIDVVAGIEARGFILASALAIRLGVGFVPVRKAGKLPRATLRETYALEYGSDSLEIHADAFAPGSNVVLVDDVLATGGTAAAATALVRNAGGNVARALFLLELAFLGGRERLRDVDCGSLVVLGGA